MSQQQEFEPREQLSKEELPPQQYSYRSQSSQARQEGMPRDESPLNYGAPSSGPSSQQSAPPEQQQVPWWARPQPQPYNSSLAFVFVVALLILFVLVIGALGVVGLVLGSLGHILAVILGAIVALLIFAFVLVLLVVGLVGRAISGAFSSAGHKQRGQRSIWHMQRRMLRQVAHDQRRMARRAARRFWQDPY